MSAAHVEQHDHHEQHGPPVPHYSSRIKPETLGMYLFIGSEIMLFGSFFAAYFFVRVANPAASAIWPPPPYHFPVFVAGVNTVILVTSSFTMHWALQSIKRNNRRGLLAGLILTILMGTAFLLTQFIEYAHVGDEELDGVGSDINDGAARGIHRRASYANDANGQS